MDQLRALVEGFEVQPVALLDIALTALLIYGLFSLIRGTRAVRLVIGVTVLYLIYVVAQYLGLQLLSQILQAGAVVGLLALVVVFQPELRRGLERIGRVGSLGWLFAPGARRSYEKVAAIIAKAASGLGAQRIGALIVIERETGLQDSAETGVMLDGELSLELLQTIFTPHSALHDGAAIIRNERVTAAGVVLPLSDTGIYRERFGTRHRAALGITEQTDAIAVVVSEETGSVGLVERGRIVRDLDETRLAKALVELLEHTPLTAVRIPERATALGRTVALRRAARGKRRGNGTAAAAAEETPQETAVPSKEESPAPAATSGKRSE
ncbi:MAG: diadenylate cyclase CdaA [Chloroflexota bacterium]